MPSGRYVLHMTERVTVRLSPELLDQAKRRAAAEGRTLNSLIEEGLRRVTEEREAPRQKRILPRVSKAKGGPMPGIDVSNSALLQELEDLEYVERMKGFK